MVEYSSDDAVALIRKANAVQKEIRQDSEPPAEDGAERRRELFGPRYLMTYFHDANAPEITAENSSFASDFYAWLDLIEPHTVGSTISPVEDIRIVSSTSPEFRHHKPPMSGYSLIKAADMEQALALAQKCPLLDIGGIVEVSHVVQLHRAYTAQDADKTNLEES